MNSRGPTWHDDVPFTQGIPVYRNRMRSLVLAGLLLCFLVVFGWTWSRAWQDGSLGSPLPTILLVVCLLVLVPLSLFTAYLALMTKPYILFTEDGIQINSPLMSSDLLHWSEIASLIVLPRTYGDTLYIYPRTPSTFASRQSRVQRLLMVVYYRPSHPVFRLPALLSSTPPRQLLAQIVQRYGHELQQNHVSAR